MIKKMVWFVNVIIYIAMTVGYPYFLLDIKQQVVLTYQISIYAYDYFYVALMGVFYVLTIILTIWIIKKENGSVRYFVWLLVPIIMSVGIWIKNGSYLSIPKELVLFSIQGIVLFVYEQVNIIRNMRNSNKIENDII